MNYPQERVQTYLCAVIFFVATTFVLDIFFLYIFGEVCGALGIQLKDGLVFTGAMSIAFGLTLWGFHSFPEYSSNQPSMFNQLLDHRYGEGIWWFPPYVTEIYSRLDARFKQIIIHQAAFTEDKLVTGLSAHFFFPFGNHRKILDMGLDQFESWVRVNLEAALKNFIARNRFETINRASKFDLEQTFLNKLSRRFGIEGEDIELDVFSSDIDDLGQRAAMLSVASSALESVAFENKAKALKALKDLIPDASPEVLANSFQLLGGHIKIDQRVLQHMGTHPPPSVVVDMNDGHH